MTEMNPDKKLRVLQLGKLYYPAIGGIEKTMQQIAEGIKDEVESSVLAAQPKGKAHRETINGVPVYYAKSWGTIASLPISFDLISYLCKHVHEYDIIHLHVPFPLGDLACLLSRFKGKLVIYWHSDIVRQKKMMIFYKPLMNYLLKRADIITIATQGNIDGSPYVKPYQEKCRLIPFAVSTVMEKESNQYWNKKVQIQEENPRKGLNLLFIGRLVYYKGCDVLLSAMMQIPDDDIELTIVGSGILEKNLKEQSKQAGIQNRIHFLGKISDSELMYQIQNCDVFVFPSVASSEAFGLVQLEAMVYGKPVINTNLPTGVPWVSPNGETGLTVPIGDSTALADAILWMKYHPEERIKMGEKARKRVKTQYTEEVMIQNLLQLYRGIV